MFLGSYLPPAGPKAITGLKLWLNASTGVTLSGSNVTSWADVGSGGGLAVTPNGSLGNLNTVNASSVNGLPGITMVAGSGGGLWNNVTNVVSAGSPRTVIVVCKPSSTSDLFIQFRTGGVSWLGRMLVTSGNQRQYYLAGDSTEGDDFNPGISLNGAGHVIEIGSTVGSVPTITLDGASQTPITTVGTGIVVSDVGAGPSTVGFSIGCYVPGGNSFAGDINELFVYDHVLLAGELTIIRGYIHSRYGIL